MIVYIKRYRYKLPIISSNKNIYSCVKSINVTNIVKIVIETTIVVIITYYLFKLIGILPVTLTIIACHR